MREEEREDLLGEDDGSFTVLFEEGWEVSIQYVYLDEGKEEEEEEEETLTH